MKAAIDSRLASVARGGMGRPMKTSLVCCAVLVALAVLAPATSAASRDRTPPTTPTQPRVVAVTEDSITIAWNASTDNSGRIHAYIAGGIYHPGTSTTKTFTGLVPNWTQTYRVQAMDPSGNVSALFSYEVLMDGVVREPATSTSTTLRTIAPGTHTFQVRARDHAGNVSGVSNAVTVTLAPSGDVTAPTAPSNLTVEDLIDNCGSQILRWTASSDNADPPSAIEYELYLNGRFSP